MIANSIPLVRELSSLIQWLLIINVLLIGAVILFAYRTITLSRRVEELEREKQAESPPQATENHSPK
ncbi:MAG: hypothetical protein K1X53_14495 [Candidatus Sumerlaeaceae bacterium]|nr:hypothetical protein [Candidatus Sumerlaeaceae bacterium]